MERCSIEAYRDLAAVVEYEPATGIVRWKRRNDMRSQWNGRYAGKECGRLDNGGYLQIRFTYQGHVFTFGTHRLIWFIFTGEIPDQVDHVNHDKIDNRIENLRAVNSAENNRNQVKRRDNTSGYTGIFWRVNRQQWEASVTFGGKQYFLGRYDHKCDAIFVVESFRKSKDFHPNHGKADHELTV